MCNAFLIIFLGNVEMTIKYTRYQFQGDKTCLLNKKCTIMFTIIGFVMDNNNNNNNNNKFISLKLKTFVNEKNVHVHDCRFI